MQRGRLIFTQKSRNSDNFCRSTALGTQGSKLSYELICCAVQVLLLGLCPQSVLVAFIACAKATLLQSRNLQSLLNGRDLRTTTALDPEKASLWRIKRGGKADQPGNENLMTLLSGWQAETRSFLEWFQRVLDVFH